MIPIVISAAAVGLLLLVGGALALRRRRRARRRAPADNDFSPIRSAVRVLATDDDLREAIERAVAYERVTASRSTARIDRYYRIVDEHSAPEEAEPTEVEVDPAGAEPVQARAELLGFETSSGTVRARRNGYRPGGSVLRDSSPDPAA